MAKQEDKSTQLIASSMRIPREVRDALTRLAKEHKRSFNAELIWALERYIEDQERDNRERSGRDPRRE